MSQEEPEIVQPTEQPELNVEDLKIKMAELQKKIEEAQRQEKPEEEKNQQGKAKELEKIWEEGSSVEVERDKLKANIERARDEIAKFEQLIQQAKYLGIPMDQNEGFMAAFQAEKDKLAGLEQRSTELMGKARNIAGNPDVMAKVHEEAMVEDRERKRQELDKLFEKARNLERQWKDLVKWLDHLKTNLPYSFWKNRGREILNKEVIDDPKNTEIMRPIIETEGKIKRNRDESDTVSQKIEEIQSSMK